MTMHTIKCWAEQFSEVRSGRKTFEFRKDDRGYRVGDVLDLREFSPDSQTYSGQFERRRVTHILSSGFGLPDGYVVMSMEAIECCGHPVHDGDNGRYILTCCEKYSTPHSQPLVTHIRPARDGDPVCYAWQVCASGEEGAVPVYEDKNGRHIVDMTDISDLRKRIASAIFDPGATEGLKGDRDLTTWQTDAVMRVLGAWRRSFEMPNSAGNEIRTTQRCGMDVGSDDRTSPVAPPSPQAKGDNP